MTFPDAAAVQDTEVLAARMGDGDGGCSSDSDVDGDFVVRKKITAKKTPVAKVVQVDSESDGSDPFEYCDKTQKKSRSQKKSLDRKLDPEVVGAAVVDGIHRDEDEFFCTPPVQDQEEMLKSLEGREFEKVDLPPEVSAVIGYDIAFVEVE